MTLALIVMIFFVCFWLVHDGKLAKKYAERKENKELQEQLENEIRDELKDKFTSIKCLPEEACDILIKTFDEYGVPIVPFQSLEEKKSEWKRRCAEEISAIKYEICYKNNIDGWDIAEILEDIGQDTDFLESIPNKEIFNLSVWEHLFNDRSIYHEAFYERLEREILRKRIWEKGYVISYYGTKYPQEALYADELFLNNKENKECLKKYPWLSRRP